MSGVVAGIILGLGCFTFCFYNVFELHRIDFFEDEWDGIEYYIFSLPCLLIGIVLGCFLNICIIPIILCSFCNNTLYLW